ncbi:MAG: DUF3261 domain-containing protein [Treponema sp.]|jgi:hypothetical protein|nr:DUF3261 domain-containing protein [Treponema sp.]
MPFRIPVSPLVFALLLLSCAGGVKETAETPRVVTLGERGRFTLLDPRYIEAPLDTVQRISGAYENGEFAVTAWVKADGAGVSMVFMSGLGISLGEFEFGAGSISLVSPYLPASIGPEYLAADFQLCYYQVEALGKALDGLTLHAGGNVRRIYEGENVIIEIETGAGEIRYTNLLRNYSYTITAGTAE